MPAQHAVANDRDDPGVEPTSLSVSELSIPHATDLPQPSLLHINELIGRYRLLHRIGSGGMGEVWRAEQTTPVRRQVALKLIKAGMDTSEVVARFQSERQALALMDHPGIAKVFEAGSTPQGRPYFVMEYITGLPITQYCDKHRMTVSERLELFVQVCDAVQHAHQKAIIHRDLKPSNILVSDVDGRRLPRVIDFGIAKALSQGLTAETQFTQTGVILGTPAYMSPEQAGSVGIDVDTRTDVYSLGVVLFEMLTGLRPLDLTGLAFDEMLLRIREEDPPRPSHKLRAASGLLGKIASDRRCDSDSLQRQLRGDVDAIVLKALEKDRSRRYGSPSDLAADIGCYLRNQAVRAVPPSFTYRAGKLVRRYRGALAAVAFCLLMLIAASGFSIWQSIRATKQRDRADEAAATAQAVSDFLQNDLLAQASLSTQLTPHAKADPDLKVRTVLDRAAARVAGKFDKQPEVEAAIRETIGRTYSDLGLFQQANEQFMQALKLHQTSLGNRNPKTLRTASIVAGTTISQGKYAQAEELLNRVLADQRQVLGSEHPDTLLSMSNLATLYREQGKYPQAEELFGQLSQVGRRVWGPESSLTLTCMDRLADVYFRQGKYSQAEQLDTRLLEIRRRILGAENPDTLISMAELANVYSGLGRYAMTETLNREILETRRRVMGPEHPHTLAAMNNLAVVYSDEGKYAQAEVLNRQALEVRRRVLGPECAETLMSMDNLACTFAHERKYSKAEALFNQTLEIERRVMGIESRFTLDTLADAAFMYQREGKYGLAERYAGEVLAAWQQMLGPDSTVTMTAAADLATVRLSRREFAEAETLAREVLDFYRKKQPDDWQRFRAESLLGESLAGQKKYGDAESLLIRGYEGMRRQQDRISVPNGYHLERAYESVVQLYQAWGKATKVLEWSRKRIN